MVKKSFFQLINQFIYRIRTPKKERIVHDFVDEYLVGTVIDEVKEKRIPDEFVALFRRTFWSIDEPVQSAVIKVSSHLKGAGCDQIYDGEIFCRKAELECLNSYEFRCTTDLGDDEFRDFLLQRLSRLLQGKNPCGVFQQSRLYAREQDFNQESFARSEAISDDPRLEHEKISTALIYSEQIVVADDGSSVSFEGLEDGRYKPLRFGVDPHSFLITLAVDGCVESIDINQASRLSGLIEEEFSTYKKIHDAGLTDEEIGVAYAIMANYDQAKIFVDAAFECKTRTMMEDGKSYRADVFLTAIQGAMRFRDNYGSGQVDELLAALEGECMEPPGQTYDDQYLGVFDASTNELISKEETYWPAGGYTTGGEVAADSIVESMSLSDDRLFNEFIIRAGGLEKRFLDKDVESLVRILSAIPTLSS
jgi:hypothetical protein